MFSVIHLFFPLVCCQRNGVNFFRSRIKSRRKTRWSNYSPRLPKSISLINKYSSRCTKLWNVSHFFKLRSKKILKLKFTIGIYVCVGFVVLLMCIKKQKILTLKFTIGICGCVVVLLMCIKFAFVVFIHNKSFFSNSNIASGNFLVTTFLLSIIIILGLTKEGRENNQKRNVRADFLRKI